jgi:peroxiredoxin
MSSNLTEALAAHQSQTGESLAHLAAGKRLLVVFLRHAGCPFCREALAQLSADRASIEGAGATIVLVHMASDGEAQELFTRYDLADVPRISDPAGGLYEAFGLARGSIWQVMGPNTWWPGLKAMLSGRGPGKPIGDVFRMPGAFVLDDGRLVHAVRPNSTSEQPDFTALAACEIPQSK